MVVERATGHIITVLCGMFCTVMLDAFAAVLLTVVDPFLPMPSPRTLKLCDIQPYIDPFLSYVLPSPRTLKLCDIQPYIDPFLYYVLPSPRTLELCLTYSPISLLKWQMYESQNMRKKWFSVLGDAETQTEEEEDVMKVGHCVFTFHDTMNVWLDCSQPHLFQSIKCKCQTQWVHSTN